MTNKEEEMQQHMHDEILKILVVLIGEKVIGSDAIKILGMQKVSNKRNPNSLPFIMSLLVMRYMDIPLKSKFADVTMHQDLITEILDSVEELEQRILKAVNARKEGHHLRNFKPKAEA